MEDFPVYSLKEEVRYSFDTGFRDSFALFQKLPELVTDFKQAFITKAPRLRFQVPADESKLLYRKVVTLPVTGQTFLIFLKCESLSRLGEAFKVILFEQATNYEEQFLFDTPKILTKDELAALADRLKSNKPLRDIFQKVVDKRMKIRCLSEETRYVAYFLEPAALEPPAPQSKLGGNRFTDQAFDIRNGMRYSLLEPDLVLPQEKDFLPQEK